MPTVLIATVALSQCKKLVDPLYQSKPDFEIFKELCRRFGKEKEYCRNMDEMEWVEKLYEDCRKENKGKFDMPPFAEFWEKAMSCSQRVNLG